MKPIYLDYNATTPIASEVLEAMLPFFKEKFGNPSSSHAYGPEARNAIKYGRWQIAESIGCEPDEIIFTSCGSESNNLAIKGIAFANQTTKNHIITSEIEHPAVLQVCEFLQSIGFSVTYLPVDSYGLVDPEEVRKAITLKTSLITIMHANNEVGTIQPINEISAIAQQYNIPFHTDAAQSVGKIKVDVNELNVDLLTIAGHKLYAPKGIGALFVRCRIKLQKQIHGAAQEHNLRSGTENVPYIVGLGQACAIAQRDLHKNVQHYQKMRDYLHNKLLTAFPELKLNGHPQKRLSNTLNLSFKNIAASTLLEVIKEQVAASAGAACHSDRVEVSRVLKAMKVPLEYAKGTVRFSTGRENTSDEIDRAVEIIIDAMKYL